MSRRKERTERVLMPLGRVGLLVSESMKEWRLRIERRGEEREGREEGPREAGLGGDQ